ncbi:hypothetical protein JCM10207_003935 [Rhodosporidiobolus poonsookiae]
MPCWQRIQAAATTPYRRSQFELLSQLDDLFDSLPSGSRPTSPLLSLPKGQQPRTAPLERLPDIITSFEKKRGIQLLTPAEREQLQLTVDNLPEGMADQPVGVEQVLTLLVQLGVTGESSSSSASEADEAPAAGRSRPASPAATKQRSRPSSPTTTRTPGGMLRPDPSTYGPADGSPVPARHRRAGSSSSISSLSFGPPSSTAASPSALASPSVPRRSLLSSLSRSSPGGKGLRRRKTFEDLSKLVVQQGGTYLGVGLDGPTGEGWDAEREAEKARTIVVAKALHRDRDLVALLAPLTYPQLKALDRAYARGAGGRSLLDVVTSEKAFRGNVEFALRGLLMGPLAWDVWLLQKALDGATTNDTLLIDLLISRSPSALALLRAAYSHRSSAPASISSTSSPSSAAPSKSLDVAVLSAYSSNARLKKAWEVALQERWEDAPDEDGSEVSEEQRAERERRGEQLLREDLDQLKVGLRRGGNNELVAKILLARSPAHLHKLVVEYRKSTAGHSSLTKAIKHCVPAGTLQRLFLHAVENAKNVGEGKGDGLGPGAWRDAKALEKAVEVEKGARREELLWRLVRLHWDRPRFLAVQQAYKHKYRKPLAERLSSALPAGALVELATHLVKSAAAPEPTPSLQDHQRLEKATSGRPDSLYSRRSSMSSLASMPEKGAPASGDSGSEGEASRRQATEEFGELEAEGEMSDPPSPRSPPGQPLEDEDLDFPLDDAGPASSTPMPSQDSFQHDRHGRDSPTPSPAPEVSRSASEDGHNRGHAKSSSLSFRQRSAPLELVGHRPPSSAGGSADSSKLSSSLRHSRPIAPSRRKRMSEEAVRQRGDSEEPLSPSQRDFRSPTPSNGSRTSLSRSTSSMSDGLGSSVGSSHSAAIGMGNASLSSLPDDSVFGSPPTLDTTSFHATPLSPPSDAQPSSSFFPLPGSTSTASTSPPAFDLSLAHSDFFSSAPESPEKYFTSLRRQGSTVSHLSSTSSDSRPTSLFAGEGGLGLPGSMFANSPAGHSRDSSSGTLGGGEHMQQLLRHANELARKLKETETRLQASASAYEEQVSDLEARLEEARSELQTKRREEKELRSTEKEHLVQINSLEADIAKLNKSLERSREAYDGMKRNYTSTCEEAERLRALVAETRRENRAAEEAMQSHALQVQQFDRDRDLLQQTINKLERDLTTARRAQDSLDDQKQENLLLKETIDKLRFEIEEMRSAGRKSMFLDNAVAAGSPQKSLAESLSKSLGREIAAQMAAQDESDSESSGEDTAGEEGEDVDDIIVTTHRRIKKRGKRSSPVSEPVVTHVETSVNVSDADIQTDAVESREMDIQTDLSAVDLDLIAALAAPELVVVPAPPKTEQELSADLAKELGVDVSLVKQFVDASKSGKASRLVPDANAAALGTSRRNGRWRNRLPVARAPAALLNALPSSARPYVAQLFDSSLTFFLYSATICLVGFVSGSHLFPSTHHHTFAPFQVMLAAQDSTAYNSMNWEGLGPATSSSGLAPEGLGHFLYELVWAGVRNARRIPT